ncbi:unnamed protein product [Caenorhabditis sp. 36 PRJEB53466]|nr:unnamed protein product [Caenorhabditis sp. 36 PRJEB53466]CAI2351954.1 unnamed protein product [Caenorhabditis sp. 36 PRJEB53466]
MDSDDSDDSDDVEIQEFYMFIRLIMSVALKRREWKKKKQESEKKEVEAKRKLFKKEKTESFKKYCRRLRSLPHLYKEEVFVPGEVVERVMEAIESDGIAENWTFSAHEQSVMYLQFATSGQSFGCMRRRIGASKSTISSIVKRVSRVIIQHIPTVRLPSSPSEWREIEETFVRRGLLRCIGCLDGKHVRVKAPPGTGSLFYNYKSYFSISMLALADADLRFRYLDIGAPGSVSDTSIFNRTFLKTILDTRATLPPPVHYNDHLVLPSFVLADGIFALTPTLMKPFGRAQLTHEQTIFNRILSNSRVRVEHAFGVLASRFRVLHSQIELPYSDAVNFVSSLVHLHNLLIPPFVGPLEPVVEAATEQFHDGKDQREALLDFLIN